MFSEKEGKVGLENKRSAKESSECWEWDIDFFFFPFFPPYLCKIILNVFSPATDKAYSDHCLKKMNRSYQKRCNTENRFFLLGRKGFDCD